MKRNAFCLIALLMMTSISGLSFGAAKKEASSDPKQLPPAPSKPISENDRKELEAGVAKLKGDVDTLARTLAAKPKLLALLPDVEIYLNAVRYPLVYNESIDVKKAVAALAAGDERVKQLQQGKAPWVTTGGPRGYRSKIDGSVQPYMIQLPPNFSATSEKPWRLEFFCHGRGEDLLELKFINGKIDAKNPVLNDALIVYPYGRYCCANKFAGEIDVLEIIDSLKRQYPIDEHRIVMTGFSMGGASSWHYAVHYADLWCAASPGAGFCETKIYQKLAEKGELEKTPWWEQKLWHLYDCPDYALNLTMCPTIAYAGELDPQQQSGDIMQKAMADLGFKLERIYGPKVPHKYEPGAKAELDKRLNVIATKGRNDAPQTVRFATETLKYNHMFWVSVDGLDHHWEATRVDAELDAAATIKAKTTNVSAITFSFAAGQVPFKTAPKIVIDGTPLAGPTAAAGKPWSAHFVKTGSTWKAGELPDGVLRKQHDLQGPIDDAFMDRFVMVTPTGQPMNEKIGSWTQHEMERAILQWHRIFRGEAITAKDTALTDADIASSNLILWGDPSSNAVLAKIADKLPIQWTAKGILVNGKTFDPTTHGLILIYPNPLNPKKYVVLNSGFTFREDSNGTNSRQVAKLPDYVVVDLNVPPNASNPGGLVDVGFFDERWQLQRGEGK